MRLYTLLVAFVLVWAGPAWGADPAPYSINPFTQPGEWYRGNTHSHTTVSDGLVSIAERCRIYRDLGYDFLVITDHDKVSDVSPYGDERFLVISGAELHPANPYGGSVYHFVAINIHQQFDARALSANEVIAEVKRQGGELVIAHPYWSGHTILDYLPLHGYFAVEVYNHICDRGIGKGYSEQTWDELLDKKGPVFGIAADDAHGTGPDSGHGWVMVKAPALTTDAIMTALRTGAFYSTQGPEILDLDLTEVEEVDAQGAAVTRRVLKVRCSPARSIIFKAQRSTGRHVTLGDMAPESHRLTEAEYNIPRGARYVRVEIIDAQGKKAWSNPLFF